MNTYIDYSDHSDPTYQQLLYTLQIDEHNDKGARSTVNVAAHVNWIHNQILNSTKSSILDLGCGIGRYSMALASQGHSVIGVDISPLVIEHAIMTCPSTLECSFIQANILTLMMDQTFDLIIFPFSIINTFQPDDVEKLIKLVRGWLNPNGIFYFEGLTYHDFLESKLYVHNPGVNEALYNPTDKVIIDNIWDRLNKTLTIYSYVLSNNDGIKKSKIKLHYYAHSDYDNLLRKHGFANITFLPNPPGTLDNDGLPYESILATIR